MGQGTNAGGSATQVTQPGQGYGAGPMGQGGGTGGFSTASGSNLLNNYTQALPNIAQAYMQSFNKGGPINVPSYQQLYGTYQDVAQRETARQAAALNEAYGSQGARYSSDIAGAQSRLRENANQDLALQSGNLLQSLRQQQFGEASNLAGLQAQLGESGLNRMFQDFFRQTSPPPLFGTSIGYNPAQPTTVVY